MNAGNPLVTLTLALKNKLKGGMDIANKFVSENVKNMKEKLSSLKDTHIKAFQAMKDEVPGFGRALEFIESPLVMITAGLIAVGGALSHARAEAEMWDMGMAKVNVTAQLGKKELHELSDQVLEIGARNVAPLQEVPEALNKIISAGLDTNTAMAALEPTLQAARAGFTDVETTASAAVSVMNSSGIMDANRVYDILFATLNRGNAEFKDIAQYLPKIIPLAKNAGFSLEQVSGSFAFLTAQGLKSEQASTGLMNVFKSLSDQQTIFGGRGKKGLKGLGINVFDAKGEARPLIDIIDQLREKTEGLTAEKKVHFFEQIGFDMESATAIGMMTQNVGKLRENIDFVTNSTGQLKAAVENSASPMDSWKIIGNQVKKTFIEIGQPINDSLGALGKKIMPYLNTGLDLMKGLLSGAWEILSGIGRTVWAIVRPFAHIAKNILDWITHSTLLKKIFEGIGWALDKLVTGIEFVADKLTWLFDHTIGPLMDALKWVANKLDSLLGNPIDAVRDQIQSKIASGQIDVSKLSDDQKQQLEAIGIQLTPKILDNGMLGGGEGYLSGLNMYKPKAKPGLNPGGMSDKEKNSTSISGKAEQVRNITIHTRNIGIDGNVVMANNDGKPLTKKDVVDVCNEIFARFRQNMETSYG